MDRVDASASGIIPVDFMAAPDCNEVDEREAYVEKKDAGDTCCLSIRLKGVFFLKTCGFEAVESKWSNLHTPTKMAL